MEKSENVRFLELLAAEKGITDPEEIKKFMKEVALSLISA